MTISQTAAPIWQSRADDSPADLAGLFRQAAKLISAEGYSRLPEGIRWQADGPHSVCSAIEAAALLRYPDDRADAADLAEDAHARLAGFLHLTGQRTRRTGIADMCYEVYLWEDRRPTGWPQRGTDRTQAEAAAVLESAAALLDVVGASS